MDDVRIKDKMRSAYTPQQWMGVQIERIKARRFAETARLEGWRIREAIYHGPGHYEWLDRQWRPYRIGDEWGGQDHTAFFRCEAQVPETFDGRYHVLRLRPGGEGLLTLNGKQLAGLDSRHEVVFLSDHAIGGETLQIEIEQYVNEMEIPQTVHRFGVAELAVLDREIEEAYFDFRCAYDVMMTPQAGNEVRAFLFDELKKAISLVDFEGDREAFGASLMRAQHYVGERIYSSGRFRHEGRLNMVGHSHIDLVYQWDYNEYLRKIGRTHSTTLNTMREFPDYLFCQSQTKLYEDLSSLYPEIYEKVRERVRDARWEVIGGMYVEPDCNLISGESLVRQLQFGREFTLREFGTVSTVCWLPDVFGIAWFVPQVLKRAGVRFLITNKPVIWNDTNEFPHNAFWWEGPDGSRILAHLPATHFGARIDADVMLTNWNEYKQKVECGEAIFNYGYADGRGGPNREDVLTGRRYKNCPGMPTSVLTHGQEAFERMEANAESLPVWRDELYLETHRGTYTTQARLKKRNRKAEILYRNAEAMSAQANLLGLGYPSEDLHEGWKLILKNQFHDILPGSHVTQAFHDAIRDYDTVFAIGDRVLTSALNHIASQISHEASRPPGVVVFNMQPWQRTDVVDVEFETTSESSFRIVDAKGHCVPFQVLSRGDGRVRVLIQACAVPPMGYMVYRIAPGQPDVSTPFRVGDASIENGFFRLRIGENGTISEIYDKKNNREVLEPGKRGNRFQLFEDMPGRYAAWDIVPMYKDREYGIPPVERSEVIETGPVRLVLQQERSFMSSTMVQRIVLHRSLPRIDFETEIEWRERDRLLKTGFPANVNAMRATYDISYGYIERPTHFNTSWDAAKFEVCGHLWADISEGDYGVSLLNDGKYGHDIYGNHMRLTLLRGPQHPDPTADLGHHSFTYSLYPHPGDWRQAETPRRAWELNDPLVAVPLGRGDGDLEPTGSFLSIDNDHVMISALKMAEDGDGLILRLYEDQNRRGRVNVTVALAPSGAVECDLYEDEIGRVDIGSGSLCLDISPFEVRTFKLFFRR